MPLGESSATITEPSPAADAGAPGATLERDSGLATSSRVLWWSPSLPGTALGIVLAALSTTPSLLPRTPVNQGLATGLAFAVGYLLGVGVAAVLLRVAGIPHARRRSRVRRWLWLAVAAATAIGSVPVVRAWWRTQNELREVYGDPALTAVDGLVAGGVAVVTAMGLVLAGKGLAAAFRAVRSRLSHRVPMMWAGALSAVALALATVLVLAAAIVAIGAVTEAGAASYNASAPAWLREPSGENRSVGPTSALSWDRAGFEGRYILGTGPSASDITAVTGTPAVDPIRIYAGVDEPGDWSDHAAAVVSELDRMHAQDRDVVVIAATTGSGWLDGEAIDALEYLHDGSTALVAMQYSKGESWHSVVFHPGAYREATTALLSSVHDWWAALPAPTRPKLYLYGLSLGSLALQDSFADAPQLRAFADGAVLAGTPYGTAMNAALTAARDDGSPVVMPVLDDGLEYRWFGDGSEIAQASGRWNAPRVLFLQHGTDPIVWAGLPSLWAVPEWLEPGQRSVSVHPGMNWVPVVTGIQLLFDEAVDLAGPDGAGHRYGYDTVEAWIAVTGDGGHPADVLDLIRQTVTPRSGLPTGGDS